MGGRGREREGEREKEIEGEKRASEREGERGVKRFKRMGLESSSSPSICAKIR